MKSTSQIQLLRMPQLGLALNHHDDWTGLTDAAERRKRQNRLNVRAHRRRKVQSSQTRLASVTSESAIPCWVESCQTVVAVPPSHIRPVHSPSRPLLPMTQAPTKLDDIILPLSSDHLITLLQYNVLRAGLCLRQLLSACFEAPDDASNLHIFPIVDSVDTLPLSLQPTLLQITIPHQHWIDIIPHPTLRDNLIRARGTFDEDDLWTDTVGGLFEGFAMTNEQVESNGIVMWNPPWHISGWEFSEGFGRKWGWMMRGCGDVLEATNKWRRSRGEDNLVVEI